MTRIKLKNTEKENLLLIAGVIAILAVSVYAFGKAGEIGESPAGYDLGEESQPQDDDKPNAPVVVEVYSDFQCPYCSRAASTVEELRGLYNPLYVDVVFKQFPLDFHKNAFKAAMASECAGDQEMFWSYHDLLFENQNRLGLDDLKLYARQLGLDTTVFNECLDSGGKEDEVKADIMDARNLGITGTPTFMINGDKIVGAQDISVFKAKIESKLRDAGVNPDDALASSNLEKNEAGLKEVSSKSPSATGSCNGACGSPSCGAATGGSCGCGG